MPTNITGIVLAGGKSRRMGTDKAFLNIGNKNMLQHAISALQGITDQLFISGSDQRLHQYNLPVVPDTISDCGPMGGLYSVIKQASTEWFAVTSCDAPLLTSGLFAWLWQQKQPNSLAVVVVHQQNVEPLAALYHRDMLPLFEKALQSGNYSLQRLLQATPNVTFATLDTSLAAPFTNVNTPDEYQKISQNMPSHLQWLMVGGNGRNVGKTTFVCNVIENNVAHDITALKITPHQHSDINNETLTLLQQGKDFILYEEKNSTSDKDTARYLQAGAKRSLLLQTTDEALHRALEATSPLLYNQFVVCEALNAHFYIKPALLVLVYQPSQQDIKPLFSQMLPFAHRVVASNGQSFSFSPQKITIHDGQWQIA